MARSLDAQIRQARADIALVVISSADCHAKAKQNNVQLISRETLARLLLQHVL
jgi:hypothetical protein